MIGGLFTGRRPQRNGQIAEVLQEFATFSALNWCNFLLMLANTNTLTYKSFYSLFWWSINLLPINKSLNKKNNAWELAHKDVPSGIRSQYKKSFPEIPRGHFQTFEGCSPPRPILSMFLFLWNLIRFVREMPSFSLLFLSFERSPK